MNLKKYLSWRTSLKIHFFDGVCIEDKQLKADILNWIFRLRYKKNIWINKFSDLFNNFEEIVVFPITVSGFSPYLQIQDNSGKEYYLHYSDFVYNKLGEYSIGRRECPYDKEFVYYLTPENEIILQKLLILELDYYNTNTNNSISFSYDKQSHVTTAILKTLTLTLEITYPSLYQISDDKINDYRVVEYLFYLANIFPDIYDTYQVLVYFSNNMLKEFGKNFSVSIYSYMNTNNTKKLLSEIHVFDGIVTKYSFTKRVNDSETCFTEQILSQDLDNFILSHKY